MSGLDPRGEEGLRLGVADQGVGVGEQHPDQQVDAQDPEHRVHRHGAFRADALDHSPDDRERGEGDEEHGDDPPGGGPELAESDQGRGRAEHRERDDDRRQPRDQRPSLRRVQGEDQGRPLERDRHHACPVLIRSGELEDERAEDQQQDEPVAVLPAGERGADPHRTRGSPQGRTGAAGGVQSVLRHAERRGRCGAGLDLVLRSGLEPTLAAAGLTRLAGARRQRRCGQLGDRGLEIVRRARRGPASRHSRP